MNSLLSSSRRLVLAATNRAKVASSKLTDNMSQQGVRAMAGTAHSQTSAVRYERCHDETLWWIDIKGSRLVLLTNELTNSH